MNISFDEYKNKYTSGITVDVRDGFKYNIRHINSSINIPVNDILSNVNILDKNKTYFLICDSGKVSLKLSRLLNNIGFNTYSIDGGYNNIRYMI